jgi:hypothetical protein
MAYRPPPQQRSPTSAYPATHGPYSPPAPSPGPRYPPQGQQFNGHSPPQRQYTSPTPTNYPSHVNGYFDDDRAGLLQHSAPQPSSTPYNGNGGYNHPLERNGYDQRVNMEPDRRQQQPRKLGYRKVYIFFKKKDTWTLQCHTNTDPSLPNYAIYYWMPCISFRLLAMSSLPKAILCSIAQCLTSF